MPIQNEIVIIESIPFATRLNAAKDLEALKYFLAGNHVVQTLITRLNIYFSDHVIVYYRILELLVCEYHHDASIITYLYVLNEAQSHLLVKALQAILKLNDPNLFWTKKFIEDKK